MRSWTGVCQHQGRQRPTGAAGPGASVGPARPLTVCNRCLLRPRYRMRAHPASTDTASCLETQALRHQPAWRQVEVVGDDQPCHHIGVRIKVESSTSQSFRCRCRGEARWGRCCRKMLTTKSGIQQRPQTGRWVDIDVCSCCVCRALNFAKETVGQV